MLMYGVVEYYSNRMFGLFHGAYYLCPKLECACPLWEGGGRVSDRWLPVSSVRIDVMATSLPLL